MGGKRLKRNMMKRRGIEYTEFNFSPPRLLAGSERGTLDLLAGLSLFYGLLTALLLAASLFSITVSRPLAFVFIIFAALAGWLYRRSVRRGRNNVKPDPPGPFATGFFYVTLALYLLLWVLAYALPDFSYDGNYYHTPTLHFWLQKGGVHWIETGGSPHWGPVGAFAWNGYPKGVEVVQFVFLLATGCSRLLNGVNLLFLPLGALAITGISLTLGARSGFALAAGCLFLYLPINIAQSLTAMVDTGSAACYLAFFALLLGTVKRIDRGKIPWRLAAGLGLALGLAAGSKGPGLFLVPAGGAVLLVRFFLARHQARKETGNRSGIPPGLRRGLLFIVIVILIGLGLGGGWAGRNWIRTGNPFYPVEVTFAGRQLFPGVNAATQFRPPYREGTEGWSQAERVLSNWLGCFRFNDPEVLVYDSRWGGLGFAWLLSIPAVLWLLYICVVHRKRPETRGIAYLPDLFFLCLVMFFAMPRHHNHMARYTIWLAGLGLPCLAVVTGRMAASAGKNSWKRFAGYAWFAAVCLLAGREAIASLRLHVSFLDTFRGKEVGGICPLRVLRAARSPYPSGYYWDDLNGTIMEMIMAGDDSVGVAIGEKNQRHLIFGHLSQGKALGRRKIVFIDHLQAENDPGYLPRLIRENDIRYVIWDSTLPLTPVLVNDSVRQDYGVGKKLWHVFTFEPEKPLPFE
ncbi:MAG: hypothetical protein V1789_04115 [PVC group bacterium]